MNLPRCWREVRRLAAVWGRYFWLPCPCCSEKFGGYETGYRAVNTTKRGYACCRWCDDCVGAERERADIAKVLRLDEDIVRDTPICLLRAGETPEEWRCTKWPRH